MNDTDKGLLAELMRIADEVPEPRISLSAGVGPILAYQEDIGQVLWTVRKLCEGMCLSGREELVAGWDYFVPAKVIEAFDAWLNSRRAEDWKRGAGTVESLYEYPEE